jgi:hypothetical protein
MAHSDTYQFHSIPCTQRDATFFRIGQFYRTEEVTDRQWNIICSVRRLSKVYSVERILRSKKKGMREGLKGTRISRPLFNPSK